MQRSKCKNSNPKKVETRGFSFIRCPNPGFGFGKMSGLPGYPGFSKPGFQSLPFTLVHAGKYRTEDKLKIQTIHKLNTGRGRLSVSWKSTALCSKSQLSKDDRRVRHHRLSTAVAVWSTVSVSPPS